MITALILHQSGLQTFYHITQLVIIYVLGVKSIHDILFIHTKLTDIYLNLLLRCMGQSTNTKTFI